MSDDPAAGEVGRPPPRPRLPTFLLSALLVVGGLLVLGLWIGRERDASDAARYASRGSYRRQLLAADTLLDLTTAESAQRGYVIAGNDVFLRPYAPARQEVYAQLRSLTGAARADPEQSRRLAMLRRLIDAKFAEMEDVLATRRAGSDAAAIARVSDSQGRVLMEQIRAIVERIVAAEDRSLQRHIAQANGAMQKVRVLIWLLLALAALAALTLLTLAWRARLERHRTGSRAHEALVRLHGVFAGSTDALILFNPSGSIEAINPATTRLLGYRPEELARRDLSRLLGFAQGEGSFKQRIGIVDGALTQPLLIDQVARHRDGRDVPVDVALGLIPLADGTHVIASLRDVSERRAAERLKDEFISTVSHELRTPLTSVVGSLGLLRNPAFEPLPEKARRLVEIADSNARRLIRLINDILDIDRIGSGQINFELERRDLAGLAEQGVADSCGLAAQKNVALNLERPDQPIPVLADTERMQQVIGNLLSNAIRFSPPGGSVTVEVAMQPGRASLCVEDNGPGVPSDFRSRLFERFAQSSAGASIPGGSGLGLAVAREIVRAHGGAIWFEEGRAGGARFCVSLPSDEQAEPAARAERPPVLICEDDPELAEVLRRMIEAEGYRTDVTGSACEALARAQAQDYAGIVLDLLLPDAGGLGAVRALRASPRTRTLPIIVVSSLARERAGEAEARTLDVVDWIDKPVQPDRLLRALDRAMRRAQDGRPTLLHVDDDPDLLDVTALALAGKGHMLRAESLHAARAILAETTPDIVILDLNLRDGSGLDLLPDLFAADGTAVPTIVYSASDLPPNVAQRLDTVLVKSRRSLAALEGKIGALLDQRARNRGADT